MENPFYNMELHQFLSLFADERFQALGDDFCIVDVRFDQQMHDFFAPARVDAYLLLLCVSGSIRISINMKEFEMKKNQMAIFIPGFIGQMVDFDKARKDDIHFVFVGISRRFLSWLNLDLNRLLSGEGMFLDSPCVSLTEEERSLAFLYLHLSQKILSSSVTNKKECLGTIISSLFYFSEGVFSHRISDVKPASRISTSRGDAVFNTFLRLLAEYHMNERNVGFYADKLCLSPKYFSKLIKTTSGRCAPDWIDSYVILEAKNFLKYSDMSIEEIVYRLHFSDQPSFTKYFKAHTGMTPAQFRKS